MNGLFDIKGKVVVMTGACGVLGSTIVKYFASEGCKVVLLDLERAQNIGYCLVSEIKAAGGEAMFLPTNVLDESALEKNLSDILAAYGTIDILLNAAGGNMGPANVQPEQTIADLDIDAMRKVCDLNIFGMFDWVSSQILLVVGGALITCFVGWKMDRAQLYNELTSYGQVPLRRVRWIVYLLRWFAPFVILLIFLSGIGLI